MTLRRLARAGALGSSLALASMSVPGLVAAQADLVPDQIGGSPAEVQIQSGPELLADLDPQDESDAEQIADIEALLEATGATLEQLTVASAFSAEGAGGFVLAVRLDGVDRAPLTSAFVTSVWEDFSQPRQVAADIAGRPVILLYEDAAEDAPPYTFYVMDETIWLIGGTDDEVAALLEQLP